MINTERESKKALLEDKSKLEREIATIKREKIAGASDASRHNESMSMYFAKSQALFSPRNPRADNNSTTKSFIENAQRSLTSRHQVFMSQ